MSEQARPAQISGGENPQTNENTTDDERANVLADYLDRLTDEFGETPRLMPLDSEGKAPIIRGRCSLDSAEGRSYLVDGDEAVRQIRENGVRGFAIYAGKPVHNTEDLVLVDVDDRETFPYEDFEPTLMVLSGSARGEHFTYRNAGGVNNAGGKDGVNGEVRAHNWFCVTPGSIHPSGGVYHIHEKRGVATLYTEDLPVELRPASAHTAPTSGSDGDGGDSPTSWSGTTTVDYTPDPDAHPLAVVRANTWIAEYLAGITETDDTSAKDFAICRAFVRAGVAEEDAQTILTESPHTKASCRSPNYWETTWRNAVSAEHDDRGDVLGGGN